MRKSILGALVAGLFAVSGGANAGLAFDLNGSLAGGGIVADAFDWGPTSFLAQGGNSALRSFAGGADCSTGACSFDVYTHAKLIGYNESATGNFVGLGNAFGEITMVAKFTEQVVSFNGSTSAEFKTTGAGYVEFYWSAAADSNSLTGANFNNGTLIGRLEGIGSSTGGFDITDLVPTALDKSPNTVAGNDYDGQQTIIGKGDQTTIEAGTISKELDGSFFKTLLAGFSISYENIGIGLPFGSVNPSDCFNTTQRLAGFSIGQTGIASECDNVHVDGLYSAQANPSGYTPNVGDINGLGLRANDFVAQADFNSSVAGAVPEPGSLALVGLALGGLGFTASRRRRS